MENVITRHVVYIITDYTLIFINMTRNVYLLIDLCKLESN